MAGRNYTMLGYADEVDIENFLLLDINNTFSAQVEDWIATAETTVNQYLGYTTASGILAEEITNELRRGKVDSDGSLKIFPLKPPIQSVSGIRLVRGTSELTLALEDNVNQIKYQIPEGLNYIDYPDYELSISGSSVINSFYDLRQAQFYTEIDYIGGFTSVPPPIRMATVNLVSDMIMRQNNKEGLEQLTQGRVTKRWKERSGGESDFVKDAMSLLAPYRIASTWL